MSFKTLPSPQARRVVSDAVDRRFQLEQIEDSDVARRCLKYR
jgi:hypothetical protein